MRLVTRASGERQPQYCRCGRPVTCRKYARMRPPPVTQSGDEAIAAVDEDAFMVARAVVRSDSVVHVVLVVAEDI